jgi:hypothetical protein
VLEVPLAPQVLTLDVARRWNGAPLPDPPLRARVQLSATADALLVEAGMANQHPARIPDAAPGARVEGLWHYDVVECFLAGDDGRYFELELGAGGHYLALAFAAPRERSCDFARESLEVDWLSSASAWTARCAVPRAWLPEPIARVNAFAIARGEFAVHAPVGGDQPDFHRPEAFPAARLPSWGAGTR